MEQNDTNVLCVRNPYERLYSTYIDKIYLPLYHDIVHQIRVLTNKTCSDDISFEDLVDYITTDQTNGQAEYPRLDRHWVPTYHLCLPCRIHYNRIIKMESFASSVDHIFRDLNISDSKADIFRKFLNSNFTEILVREKLSEVLAFGKANVFECINYQMLMKKVWISFKIQGIIPDRVDFPLPLFSDLDFYQEVATVNIFS